MAPRILLVNHVGAISGAEQSLLVLLQHLDRRRYRPELACPAGDLADAARQLGVPVRPLPVCRLHRGGPVAAAVSAARLAAFTQALSGLVPMAAIVHANSAIAAMASAPWAILRRRPLLWHVRDLRHPPGAARLLRPTVRQAVAISRAVAASLSVLGFGPGRVAVVPNALDAAACQPRRPRDAVRAELGLTASDRVVAVVGQLVPWKGHDLLLDAMARLTGGGRPGTPHLLVVGDDLFGEHGDWVAALRGRAGRPPLAGHVHWCGYQQPVADYLAAADVLALPSRDEPFGRVLLDAMALSLPVVATAGGGVRDIVVAERTGLLVPTGRADALADALDRVLRQPDLAGRLGRAGHQRLLAHFAPPSHARAVMALYDRLRGDAPSPQGLGWSAANAPPPEQG